ncbi:MAG: BolA family protein [Parvibaculales bacterium]
MKTASTIRQKIAERFSPVHLDIIDESHLHKGHAGYQEGGETHFRLLIVASAFEGLSRLQRQRAVNECLAEELQSGIHALAMKTRTPAEQQKAEADG